MASRGYSLLCEDITDDPVAAEKALAAGEAPPEPWLTQIDLDRVMKWLTDPESAKVSACVLCVVFALPRCFNWFCRVT